MTRERRGSVSTEDRGNKALGSTRPFSMPCESGGFFQTSLPIPAALARQTREKDRLRPVVAILVEQSVIGLRVIEATQDIN